MISLVLPVGPTLNRYLGVSRSGIRFKMKEGIDYCNVVQSICISQRIKPIDGDVVFTMHLYRAKKIGDLLNRDKVLCDALEGYAYHNDNQIVEFHAFRHDDKDNPRVHVLIDSLK